MLPEVSSTSTMSRRDELLLDISMRGDNSRKKPFRR